MNRIIDSAVGLILFSIVFLLGSKIFEILGGSTILLTVYAFSYYLSVVYKKFRRELSIVIIAALILIGINYLAYIEISITDPRINIYIIIGFIFLSLSLIISFLVAMTKNIGHKDEEEIKKDNMAISKRIFQRIAYILYLSWIFVLISGLVFLAVIHENSSTATIKESWLKFVPLGAFWLVVAFTANIINLKKIESYIFYILQGRERINIVNLKKYLVGTVILLFAFGSGMEIVRGFWFLWIETFLLFCLFMASLWCILRYYFDDRIIVKEVEVDEIKTIATDFNYLLKTMGIFVVLGTLYTIVLIILLLS